MDQHGSRSPLQRQGTHKHLLVADSLAARYEIGCWIQAKSALLITNYWELQVHLERALHWRSADAGATAGLCIAQNSIGAAGAVSASSRFRC